MATPRVMSRFQSDLAASRRSTAETSGNASAKITFRNGALLLLVAIVYYVATKVGFAFTPAERPISTFWPPNALLLTTLLLAPRRMWWMFLLAVLPAHLIVQLQTGVPLATAFGWFIGNTTEALIGLLASPTLRIRLCCSRAFEALLSSCFLASFSLRWRRHS
jgi:integral membrane sensor domain MASE1